MTIKHIFVIGAGTMGNGIAQTAAMSGFTATCMDVVPAALEKAKAVITKSVGKLLEKGVITAAQRDAVLRSIMSATWISSVRPIWSSRLPQRSRS